MANFTNSILTSAIWEASKEFQSLEERTQNYGAIKLMQNNNSSFPEVARLASSGQKPLSIRLDNFTPTTAGTSISCSPTSVGGDSTDTALSWNTISNVVTVSQKRQNENSKTVEQQTKIDFKRAISGMHDALETAIINFINTNRSGYSIAVSGLSTWTSGGAANYNSIALARIDRIRSSIKSEMTAAKYKGNINLLMSTPYDEYFGHTNIQGIANATNMQDQMPGFSQFITNQISTVSSTSGGIYAIPMGGVVMFIHVDPQYLQKKSNKKVDFSSIKDPLFGFDIGMATFGDCADTTAINGGVQDIVDITEFHFEYAFATPALSSPSLETAIHKYALAST